MHAILFDGFRISFKNTTMANNTIFDFIKRRVNTSFILLLILVKSVIISALDITHSSIKHIYVYILPFSTESGKEEGYKLEVFLLVSNCVEKKKLKGIITPL